MQLSQIPNGDTDSRFAQKSRDRFGFLHSWALIVRPDEESLLESPEPASADEAAIDESAVHDADASRPRNEPEYAKPEFASLETSSRSKYSNAAAEFWTPQRKAEITKKLKKPSSEAWQKMSEEQRKQMKAERSKAIAEYKRALTQGGNQGKAESGSGGFNELKKDFLKSRSQ